jgi:hypothetical protein
MTTPETDGFKVLAAWNHHGMILFRRSRNPAQFDKLDTVSNPGRLGRKGGASRAKSTTADTRKAARDRWQNR